MPIIGNLRYGQTSGKYKRLGSGAPTVLQYHDEQEIVLSCQVLAEMGFGVTRKLVGVVVTDYVRENEISTPFTDGIPGKDWWQRFLKRWPTLSERKPQHLSMSKNELKLPMLTAPTHFLIPWRRLMVKVGWISQVQPLPTDCGTAMRLLFAPLQHPQSCSVNEVQKYCMKLAVVQVESISLSMLPAVLAVSVFLHSSSTKGRICTNDGWREVLQVLFMEYLTLAGWTVTTFHGLRSFICLQSHTSQQVVQSTYSSMATIPTSA